MSCAGPKGKEKPVGADIWTVALGNAHVSFNKVIIFFYSTNGLNEKKKHSNAEVGITPAELLYSDSGETFPPLEYTDQHCRL